MNYFKTILILLVVLSVHVISACEITWTLKQKVDASDFVVLGKITGIKPGKVDLKKHRQEVNISFEVEQAILGKCDKTITIQAFTVDFMVADTMYSSTAGFKSNYIYKSKRYIAYLKDVNGSYQLTYSTNQCLEMVGRTGKIVTDIGQTTKLVPLDYKLNQLKGLVKIKQLNWPAKPIYTMPAQEERIK